MEKLPTAEAFMLSSRISNPVGEMFRLNLSRDCHVKTEKDIQQAMIEFAKLHVEAALKARDELYQTYYAEEINWTEDNIKFIKNSYPLENIK
jgi:hypothetical protein